MALIVEDGTGMIDADSYMSLVEAADYHTKYTIGTEWASATDANRERALRQASRYIDDVYGARFRGTKVRRDQSLEWPRFSAVDRDGWVISSSTVPPAAKYATAELARRALTTELRSDVLSGSIIETSIKAGPITDMIKYDDGGQDQQLTYTVVDDLLSKLLEPLSLKRM